MSVFRRLAVETKFNLITTQRALVSWAFEPSFNAPGPYTFTLQRCASPSPANGDWTDVATVVDQPWLYDNSPLTTTLHTAVFYRVVLVDGDGISYVSQAASDQSYWDRYDWSIAREIIRKENMLLRKRTGVKGWLLKRRTFGDPCPACVDPATGRVTQAHCPQCFGVGYNKGYYPAQEYWVSFDPVQRKTKLDANVGLMIELMETARGLAYPSPTTGDLWVHGHNNVRYIVASDIAAIARHRGIDLVLSLRLQELSPAHAAYSVEVPCQ